MGAGLIAVALAVLAFALTGCSHKPVGVSFTVEEINLYVGETRDLYPYLDFEPALSSDRAVEFKSDGDCVTIDGTSICGTSAGKCTVTAVVSGGSATLKVNVAYRPANRVDISASALIQNVDALEDAQPITFTAELDDYVDPDCAVDWYVNGVKSHDGRTFDFQPSYLGEYMITVAVGDVTDTESVKIYRKTDAYGSFDGALTQSHDYSPVTFTVHETIDTRNPRSAVEWRVNGEMRSDSPIFEFVPTAQGEYTVELYVNGVKRKIGESESVTVNAVGEYTPRGDVKFDADGVYVVWKGNTQATSVSVTAPDGKRTVYSRSDVTYSSRFSLGMFDATDLIEVCADRPSDYVIRVTAGGGGEPFTFSQYPKDAESHIKTRTLCYNSFIDGAKKAEKWLDELYACGTTNATGYLARGTDGGAIVSAITDRAKLIGLNADVKTDGSFITVSLESFAYYPESAETSDIEQSKNSLPHIEYDVNNIRSIKSYVMSSDRRAIEIKVENTEQLWRAAISEYKPAPVPNSAAADVYKRARAALIAIVGTDYNDYKKAHAVHDWLQWTTVKTQNVKKSSSADYLESVFGGAVTSSSVSTSAGLAKAFALMCGMEGVDCSVEIANSNGAPYYYNKVKIDGLWYVVDVYGGETSYQDGTPKKNYEIISHSRLFITDERAAEYGLDPSGEPAFDECSTYLVKHARDGVYFDYYVDRAEMTDKAAVYSAIAYSFESAVTGDIWIFAIQGSMNFGNNSVVTEFALDKSMTVSERQSFVALCDEAIEKYIKENSIKLLENGISYLSDGNVLQVITHLSKESV